MLAMVLETGTVEELTDLSRGAEVEAQHHDALLARAESVAMAWHRNWVSAEVDEADLSTDLVERAGRMCTFTVMWHPNPGTVVEFLPLTPLTEDDVADLLAHRDTAWLTRLVDQLTWLGRHSLAQLLTRRFEIVLEPTRHNISGWLQDQAIRLADTDASDAEFLEEMRHDPHASAFLAAVPDCVDQLWACSVERVIALAAAEGLIDVPMLVSVLAEGIRTTRSDWELAGYVTMVEHLSLKKREFEPFLELWPRASTLARRMDRDLLTRVVTTLARSARLTDRQVVDWMGVLREEHAEIAVNATVALAALAAHRRYLTDKRVGELLAFVVEGPSGAAARVIPCVRALSAAGRLTDAALVNWMRSVLLRPERALADGVISLATGVLENEPDRASSLLPALATALSHPETDTQEQALALITTYGRWLDDASRVRVGESLCSLPATMRRRTVRGLGRRGLPAELLGRDAHVDLLPEACPAAVPAAAPLETVEDVVAKLEEVLDDPVVQPMSFERVLDGLVRVTHTHGRELARALHPVLRSRDHLARTAYRRSRIALVAFAAAGQTGSGLAGVEEGGGHDVCGHRVLDAVLTARLEEIARRVRDRDNLPFLLSTPSLSTGQLDARVLLDRLTVYGLLGVRPGEYDFDQALLRLRPDAGVLPERVEALGTPEASRLARWLEAGCLTEPSYTRVVRLPFEYPSGAADAFGYPKGYHVAALEEAGGKYFHLDPGFIRFELGQFMDHLDGFSPVFRALGASYAVSQEHCEWGAVDSQSWQWAFPLWLSVVPDHPDLVVSRSLSSFAQGAEYDKRGCGVYLPLLAGTPGQKGPAIHLALAYGMGASKPGERAAAADALLILAGSRKLDSERLGRDIVELVSVDGLRPKRVADALRAASATAPALVLDLLAIILPSLLPEGGSRPRAGLADLLNLAAGCAEVAPGGPQIKGMCELASRRGNSVVIRSARRILESTAGDGRVEL